MKVKELHTAVQTIEEIVKKLKQLNNNRISNLNFEEFNVNYVSEETLNPYEIYSKSFSYTIYNDSSPYPETDCQNTIYILFFEGYENDDNKISILPIRESIQIDEYGNITQYIYKNRPTLYDIINSNEKLKQTLRYIVVIDDMSEPELSNITIYDMRTVTLEDIRIIEMDD